MEQNDTGREPTDAELERRFERWWSEEGVGTMPRYGQDQDEFNRSLTHAAWMNGAFVASGARPMPDTPAPGEERRTVCVYDKLDPDYVYRPDDGGEYRMQVDRRSGTTPAAPVIGSNQCEHGHLARVCVTCELIAAEARIADLERENAALGAERHEAISNYHTTLESLVGIMDEVSARFFDSDSRREWKKRRHLYTSIIERKKEAPDAE